MTFVCLCEMCKGEVGGRGGGGVRVRSAVIIAIKS